VTQARPPLPDSYQGLFSHAQMAQRSGDVEGAIAIYRRLNEKLDRLSDRILERRPDLREMHQQAGLALSDLLLTDARYAEAYAVRSHLLDRYPDLPDDWRRDLATLRIAKGEVDAGLAELQALAEEEPSDPTGWLVLGTEARTEGRFAESEAALDRAVEVAAQDAEQAVGIAYYQRFLLFKAMGRLDAAIAAWEEAVSCDAAVGVTVHEVYSMLTDAGRFGEARSYVARDTNPLRAGLQRGLLANLTGNPAEARHEWRAVAQLDPLDHEQGHECWVEAVLRLGDSEPALEFLQVHLAQNRTPRLFVLSGIGWAMRDDEQLASVLFQQAISLVRRRRPPKQKLDSSDWRLLDSLVTDENLKTALKPYFAVVETVWGQVTGPRPSTGAPGQRPILP
jgi:tetratricopeptide (TPR) repeat protein